MQYQMERIAEHSDTPDLVPRVRVINADVLNAFALPGGYVYVFRGLIERAPDLHSVMGVLGHEWAHVTARHGTRGMTRGIRAIKVGIGIALIGVIGAEFIDDDKQLLKQIVQGSSVALGLGGAQLYILSRGRKQELEADRLGSQYAQSAGFKPTGIATMFREFKRLAPQGNSTLEKALSSHPHHDERIDKNLIYSSLFYPKANSKDQFTITVNNEQINYQDALAQLSSMEIPSKVESQAVASAFVQTLHAQNEANILKTVQPLIDNLQASILEQQEAKEEVKEEDESNK
jgi:predicted Zn-dependent protease